MQAFLTFRFLLVLLSLARRRCKRSIQGSTAYSSSMAKPRSRNTTIVELGPKDHIRDGLLGPNSIMVVYVDPRGSESIFGGSWDIVSTVSS